MNTVTNKYLIIAATAVLVLVFLIGGVVFYLFVFRTQKGNMPTVSSDQIATTTNIITRKEIPEPSIKVGKYILGGKVTALNGVEISITLERLFAGDNGNYMATDNKVARISSSTEIVIGKLVNKRYSEVPGNISDIKNGQNLTFYSGENIRIMHIFSPYKIIITQ